MDGRNAFVFLQAMLLITLVSPVASQDGFLSIDCGSDRNYTDKTGIQWVTDANFISTGKTIQNVNGYSQYNQSIGFNQEQARSLRYFDEGRNRECYVLPVTPGETYLFRLSFVYGDTIIATGSALNVYINATLWFEVDFTGSSLGNQISGEAIVFTPGALVNICLVRTKGTLFISSLELRKLAAGMYLAAVGDLYYLSLQVRYNLGADISGPTYVRYPDDKYDRLWRTPGTWDHSAHLHVNKSNFGSSPSLTPERPPPKVMETAWVSPHSNIISMYGDLGIPLQHAISTYCYFEEVDGNASASNVRGIDYYVNQAFVSSFNASDQPLEITSPFWQISPATYINISFVKAPWSNLTPIINAVELYDVYTSNTSATSAEDVRSLAALQSVLNLTEWTGDPCFPIPFEWLSCDATTTSRIISLDLSRTGLTDIFPTGLGGLPKLSVLKLSDNNLSGNVMEFVKAIDFYSVRELYVENNSLEGQFSTDLLVDKLQSLKIAMFDRNVKISGLLNLSGWYMSLLSKERDGSRSALQLISLTDNNITDIYPKLEVLSSTIEAVFNLSGTSPLENGYGVLLGGNPWCTQTKTADQALAQQYLCRYTTNDFRFVMRSKTSSSIGRNATIIIGVLVGSFTLLLSCIIGAILWKLRTKASALREIHEALAKQKVHPPFYSYGDLRLATENFSSENKLGQGAFGAVYKGVLADGTLVAVKKLFPSKKVLSKFLNETVLIMGIKHRNLVQLKGCCITENQRLLVYEYAENGNLAETLWDAPSYRKKAAMQPIALDWQKRLNICVGIARGLSYLHEELQPRIIHRDIKPANILMDRDLNAKIADFGLARPFLHEESRADYTQVAGTLGYFAPEYATQGHLTEKADVFSFGVVLLEIVSGRKCINHQLPEEKVFLLNWAAYLREEGRLIDLLEPAIHSSSDYDQVKRVIDIAFLCLHPNPASRPSMSLAVSMLTGIFDVKLYKETSSNKRHFANVPYKYSTLPNSDMFSEIYSGQDQDLEDNLRNAGGSLQMSDVSGR